MFKSHSVYIKIRHDFVEITNLETDETVSKHAIHPFSSTRNIVAQYNNAFETIDLALQELGLHKHVLPPRVNLLIQQAEAFEDGINEIEKRALRDLGEQLGAHKVVVVKDTQPLDRDEAIKMLE